MLRSMCVVLLTLLCVGCERKLPATIEGTITIDGQSLPQETKTTGEVMFYPTGGGAAAYAPIMAGGKYSVNTGGSKGLEPGEYKVTVRVVEIPPEPPGGFTGPPPQKMISPPRYQDRDQSGLLKTVEPGKNTIDLDITTK
jgi:hypothetical protein